MFSWLKPASVFLRQPSIHQLHTGLKSLPLFQWKTFENSEQLCTCKAVGYASGPCRAFSSLSPEDQLLTPSPNKEKAPRRYGYETDEIMSSGGSTKVTEEGDPLPLFMSEDVQTWLQKMTGFDIEKICAPRPFEADKPTYRLLTQDELEKEKQRAIQIAKRRLQMPPVMKIRDGSSKVLQKDPDLNMFSNAKHVFTDISFGLKDRKRLIVVREPDGTLRTATDKERDRLNQVYFPEAGRAPVMPRMFEEEYLETILEKGQYRYILDRACLQFDPDNPEFIRVTHRTYEAVCERHQFDVLRSTRHFGPMAFYFAWYKKIEPLLADMVQRDLLTDGVNLIKLYFKMHQELSSTVVLEENIDELSIIKNFCEKIVKNPNYKGQLQLVIQAYEAALPLQAKHSQS